MRCRSRHSTTISDATKRVFADLAKITSPNSVVLSRKKELRPLEDTEPIECERRQSVGVAGAERDAAQVPLHQERLRAVHGGHA